MVNKLVASDELLGLVEILKSESGVSGYRLRNAHISCGKMLGEMISNNEHIANMRIGIVVIMRSGLYLATGIAERLEIKGCKVDLILDTDTNVDFNKFNKIIICDGVVNTGNTINSYINKFNLSSPVVATTVIPEENIDKLNEFNLYTCRISKHRYTGSKNKEIKSGKGPDTGDRLFSSIFYE